jgi:metallo-beta-lactamase family protein
MIHISTGKTNLLLDCGLVQTNNLKEDYLFNSRKFDFRVNELDYVFISHLNADHCLLLPRLYKEGCTARIVISKGSIDFLKEMMKDSAYIMSRDIMALNKKSSIKYKPLYEEEDIYRVLDYVDEYNFNEQYQLSEEISFKLLPANHIPYSAQTELIINQNNHIKRIGYTGDLGNIRIKNKYFVEDFVPIKNCNLLIGECTYSRKNVKVAEKRRDKDIEKIIYAINQTCIQDNEKILIPAFALDRVQTILALLYEIYGKKKDFDVPIYIDSPLACRITQLYHKNMTGRNKEILDKIYAWKNVKFIKEYADSQIAMQTKGKALVISSSGMLDKGHSHDWCKYVISNPKATILFVGYSAFNTLASKIKNGNKEKYIKIDNRSYKNLCKIMDLSSFSAHMQRENLLEYYSEINCEKIALVHSEMNSKIEFSKELQELISKKNKTSRVICVNNDMVINL